MADTFYPDFNSKIISTYDRAIKRLNDKMESADNPNLDTILPSIILDPSGDINIDEKMDSMFKYSNLAPGLAVNLYEPIYEDDNTRVVAAFNRFIGNIEITMLLQSIYEYLDMRIFSLQFFKNVGRHSRPVIVSTFLPITELM